MKSVALAQTTDGMWVARDDHGQVIGAFYPEDSGWWYGALANGTSKRLWAPAGPAEVARRLFRT